MGTSGRWSASSWGRWGGVIRETVSTNPGDTYCNLGCADLSRYSQLVVTVMNASGEYVEVSGPASVGSFSDSGFEVTVSSGDMAPYSVTARMPGHSNSEIMLVQGIPRI